MMDTLWTSLPVACLIVSPDDRIVLANNAAESFFNTSEKSLSGHGVPEKIVANVGLIDALARVRRTLAPLALHDITVTVGTNSSRTTHLCDMHMALLAGQEGHILLLLQPREIAERLSRGKSSSAAAKSAIGMAEMLAHEIKNPLAGITGAAQLLSMHLSVDDLELTELIVEESRRIVKLLEQVEQFGNLRAPLKAAVNIHDVLDRARRSAMVGFASHCAFREDYDPSLPATYGDADQLLQVFLNLLKNAAQVLGAEGQITIRTFYELSLRVRKDDGTGAAVPLQVEIIDNGPGVPDELAGNIFEPFVSGRENGTGLGLALVSKIIADHDGWISLRSEPGRTVFRVSLPMAPKHIKD